MSELLEIIKELEYPIRLISVGIMLYLTGKGIGKFFHGDSKE